MYDWRGPLWLFSFNGYHEERKFMQIEADKKLSQKYISSTKIWEQIS